MLTVLKVRDSLARYDADPGRYQHPPGTVATRATAEAQGRKDRIVGG